MCPSDVGGQKGQTCSFFRVKWVAISNQGSTREPAKHLINNNAKSIMDKYLADKADIFDAGEQRKKYILLGVLVNTGNPIEVVDNAIATAKGRRSRSRFNSSPYTVHFSKWHWDNIVTPAGKRSACSH